MKTLTVFTPTFNRAYCLGDLYESLCRQTSKDFVWLIIDDGSSDGTAQLVQSWIEEQQIEIHYIYKENGGMHTAHNTAYENMTTELNVCIDSDDLMTDDAVEKIISFWSANKSTRYAGLLGLDVYKDGRLVSSRKFPPDVASGKYGQLKGKYSLVGDIKFVYRTDVIRDYMPYPTFPGENFTPLGYKYLEVDYDYDMLFLNQALCIVDYRPDGNSHNLIKQYFKNPKGFIAERKVRMTKAYTFKERFQNSVHFVASHLILRDYRFFLQSSAKVLTLFAFPFGIIYFLYLRYKLKYDRTRKFQQV